MASLTLKNIPEDLIHDLRAAAEGDRRSLNQEILYLLISAIRGRSEKRSEARSPEIEAQLSAWRKLAGKWKSEIDAAGEVEELREHRSPGREVDL